MSETESLRVACPECGKRLRIKPALEGKRLKCPSCSTSFQAKPDNQEENERPRKQPRRGFPWIKVVGGMGAALLLAFLAFLLLGAKSEARNAKDQLAESEEKLKELAGAKEDATKRLAMAERKTQELAIEIGSVEQKLGPLQKTVKDKDSTIERLTKDLAIAKQEAQIVKEKIEEMAAAKEEAQAAKKKIENLTEQLAAAKKTAKSSTEPWGKVGPWEFGVVSFDTKNEFVFEAGRKRFTAAQGENLVAVVKVRLKSVRQLNEEEQQANQSLKTDRGKSFVDEFAIELFGKNRSDPMLFSSGLMLMYLQGEGVNQKMVFSRATVGSGANVSFDGSNLSMIMPGKAETELTLAFEYHPKDKNPIIILSPTPKFKEIGAGRITFQQDGKPSVEYGTLEEMRKYIPKGLKSRP